MLLYQEVLWLQLCRWLFECLCEILGQLRETADLCPFEFSKCVGRLFQKRLPSWKGPLLLPGFPCLCPPGCYLRVECGP